MEGDYFVSTERGIIHICANEGRFLTSWTGYGLAVSNAGEKTVAVVVEEIEPHTSRIVVLDYDHFLDGCYFHPFSVLRREAVYRQRYKTSNGRIHQINTCAAGKILCAATEENAIVIVDLVKRNNQTIYPFSDQFGNAIKSGDHNHINSVCFADDKIWFIAYRANRQSLIGCIGDDGLVYGWFMEPTGYHDIYVHEKGFLTCDTFGREGHGRVVCETGCWMSDYLTENALALRGISQDGTEYVFGYSHKGPRAKRFSGNGGILTIRGDGRPQKSELPAAQVYQIVQSSGGDNSSGKTGLWDSLVWGFGEPARLGAYEIHDD